jgi:hypothetical protein
MDYRRVASLRSAVVCGFSCDVVGDWLVAARTFDAAGLPFFSAYSLTLYESKG